MKKVVVCLKESPHVVLTVRQLNIARQPNFSVDTYKIPLFNLYTSIVLVLLLVNAVQMGILLYHLCPDWCSLYQNSHHPQLAKPFSVYNGEKTSRL